MRRYADARAQGADLHAAHILPVDEHCALAYIIEAGNQVHQRGFARARAADHAHRLAGAHGEGYVGQRFRARPGIADARVAELHPVGRGFLFILRVHGLARGHFQHALDAVAAGHGLGDVDDQVGQLDQLHQNLGHVVIQRHHRALGDHARLHAEGAGVDQGQDGQVDDHIGDGVHQGRDAAHVLLRGGEFLIFAGKIRRLLRFLAEGANHANARQVFAGNAQHLIQQLLHLFVQRHADEHDAKHHHRQHRNGRGKPQRRAAVHGESHEHRAKHHKGRAQQQAQRQVQARLHLVHIRGHAGDDGRGAHGVQRLIREALDMGKQRVPQLLGEAHGGLGGKVLRRDRAQQADQAQRHQHQAHAHDVAAVALADAGIDDRGHHQRHDQLKESLQQLKQRP